MTGCRTEVHRFMAKVLVGDGCWEWTASRSPGGYGQFRASGRLVQAHRYMWELLRGPIPQGMQLDHLCRNRSCVRPDHLEPVTGRENALRGEGAAARRAAQTHCVNGHPFDEANTYWRKDGKGARECRACDRERQRLSRARRAAPVDEAVR